MLQAIAPQEAPQDDEQHALLAKDVGVATDHEAFVLWRLTQHLGAGAFSKVLYHACFSVYLSLLRLLLL